MLFRVVFLIESVVITWEKQVAVLRNVHRSAEVGSHRKQEKISFTNIPVKLTFLMLISVEFPHMGQEMVGKFIRGY